jgi:putative transposase
MARPPLRIPISGRDQKELHKLLESGIQPVRVVLRALALLHLADGASAPATARSLKKMTAKAVRVIGHRYREGGLERALYEKKRPGAAQVLTAADKQRIIAMVCSDPPEGRARWTIRLITQEAVKRKLAPRVGRETIRILLESHDLKPWREKNVVYRRSR